MSEYFRDIEAATAFDAARAIKVDLARGATLFAGLNTFEPGQSQRLHAHADADKFYLLLSGKARMTVAHVTREVSAGMLVWAPAGVPHGVDAALERTVMLVAMAPPPGP